MAGITSDHEQLRIPRPQLVGIGFLTRASTKNNSVILHKAGQPNARLHQEDASQQKGLGSVAVTWSRAAGHALSIFWILS